MRRDQRSARQSLVNAQTFIKTNPQVAALADTPAAQQLDAAIVSLNGSAAAQASVGLDASVHRQNIEDLARTLVQSYMKPVAQFARKSLKGIGTADFAALRKVPRTRGAKALAQHARAMATAAAPVSGTFAAAKFAPDFFTTLGSLADQLSAAIDARDANTARGIEATEGIRKAISSGRAAIGMLDPVVSNMLADHELLAAWHSVKRARRSPSSTTSSVPTTPPTPATPTTPTAGATPAATSNPEVKAS